MAKQQLSAFILIFLGMLTAFGPLVTDMYLPTLPQMVGEFHTSPTMIQLGLTTCMAGLAIGQLFFGPLSDKYGRKPLLVAGMALFLASTAGCLYAQTGMQFASANTLAMDAERRNAGTASAVLGALGFLLGGLVPPLVGVGNVLTATGLVFCAGAAGIFVCSRHALRSLLGRRTSGAGA